MEHNIVEVYIDCGNAIENKQHFDQVHAKKIEIESRFGAALSWERLDHRKACRIKYLDESGGYRSPEQEWPAIQTKMVDRMTKFEAALLPALQGVVIPEKS